MNRLNVKCQLFSLDVKLNIINCHSLVNHEIIKSKNAGSSPGDLSPISRSPDSLP